MNSYSVRRFDSRMTRSKSFSFGKLGLVGLALLLSVALIGPSVGFAQDAPPADAAVAAPDAPAVTPAPETPAPTPEAPADAADPASAEPTTDTPDEPAVTPPVAGEPSFPEAPLAEAIGPPEPAAEDKVEPVEEEVVEEEEKTFNWAAFGLFVLIMAGLIAIPWALAQAICKAARMPEYTFRIWATLFCLSAGIVILATNKPTLGIDLRGGVILVYEAEGVVSHISAEDEAEEAAEDVEQIEEEGEETNGGALSKLSAKELEEMAAAIKRRIDPSGTREIDVRRLGANEIKIIIPGVDEAEVNRLKRVISDAGTLEFRILASRAGGKHDQWIQQAQASPNQDVFYQPQPGGGRKVAAWWVPVKPGDEEEFEPGLDWNAAQPADYLARRKNESLQVLVVRDKYDVTGDYLRSAVEDWDNKGQRIVSFRLSPRGGQRFAALTSEYKPNETTGHHYRLGIILSDYLQSAPNINDVIHERGQISGGEGGFEKQEVEDLVAVLDAGKLPAKLSRMPVSELHTGPTLGQDTINKGTFAIIVSSILVLVFMLLYYHKAGIVACFAVVTNLVMIVSVMMLVKAAFTLPGLAGLVLTVGMAVDANVLIFERIREELDRNATLRMAIRNGFQRAFSAIIDANITTLIIAVILYYVGSEQVKGFAVTLFLGVTFSMFTAIYCSRAIFDISERLGLLGKLSMFRLVGQTNIDFMGKRMVAGAISCVLIVIGLVAVVGRGSGMLDIDFNGGVSVQAVFKEAQDVGQLRSTLGETLPDLAVHNVRPVKEDGTLEEPNRQFIINTSTPPEQEATDHLATVRSTLEEKYGKQLEHYSMEYAATQSADGLSTTVELTFAHPFNYETVKQYLDDEISVRTQAEELPDTMIYTLTTDAELFEKEGPQDLTPYTKWTATFDVPSGEIKSVLEAIKAEIDATPYFPSSSTIGASIAGQTQRQAIFALSLALISIIAYVWFRFKGVIFGIAAVIALVHDVLITLGMLAISAWLATPLQFLQVEEFKIGLPVLAAFLTIIGYSLNDTIVVFDRIREVRGKSPNLSVGMINTSLNQTLARTLLTSLTTLIVVVILYFFGGAGIHTFAFALVVGVLVGTYSSIFIASPALHMLFEMTKEEKRAQ